MAQGVPLGEEKALWLALWLERAAFEAPALPEPLALRREERVGERLALALALTPLALGAPLSLGEALGEDESEEQRVP